MFADRLPLPRCERRAFHPPDPEVPGESRGSIDPARGHGVSWVSAYPTGLDHSGERRSQVAVLRRGRSGHRSHEGRHIGISRLLMVRRGHQAGFVVHGRHGGSRS